MRDSPPEIPVRAGAMVFVALGLLLTTIGTSSEVIAWPGEQEVDSSDPILIAGGPDEMKSRNILPARAYDPWTLDILRRIYESVVLPHPTEDRPMAWIAKGIDFDEDGTFEASEYDLWAERSSASSPLQIVAYYDFSGVRWHDGVHMTPWDLFFSYHVSAMNPRFNSGLRPLFLAGEDSTYEPGRQLNLQPFDGDGNPANGFQRTWEGEAALPGGADSPLRLGVQFTLTNSFAPFNQTTLAPVMLPMHLWSRTGNDRHTDASAPPGPDDYGCAVWIPPSEASGRGIPECGNPDPVRWGSGIGSAEIVNGSRPFDYRGAETWSLADQDVVGHGPFESLRLVPGVETSLARNDDFYTGIDPGSGAVYDARLAKTLRKPAIAGVRFKVFTTAQVGVFALQSGEIDYYHWNVGADFLGEVQCAPGIAVQATLEPGFSYLAFNLRKSPWGYERNDPSKDVGFAFRKAMSHIIDRPHIVQNLLRSYGIVGYGVVSPANTRWYDDNFPKPGYDLPRAIAILDDLATPGGDYYDSRFTVDPQGVCDRTNPGGCRSLPDIGNAPFDILTPQADYDPVRASAGALIASRMRQVGINAQSMPSPYGELAANVHERSFDAYILDAWIKGADPDYLVDFFHSRNAGAGGLNHAGFNNASFDQVISASRVELDPSLRRDLIFDAQAILADHRPYEVLYYRTNLEAYRQDRFVNWTVHSGTLWNFWSLQAIHTASALALHGSIAAPSATSAGGSIPVTVTVFDEEARRIPNALVIVSVDPRATHGNLSVGGGWAKTVSGNTDINGALQVVYSAADVPVETNVLLNVVAVHADFADPFAMSRAIRVHPSGVSFLSLHVDLPAGNRLRQSSLIPMTVIARDQNGNSVPLASVGVELSRATGFPDGLTAVPPFGTADEMAQVTLAASETAALGAYCVSVRAELEGFVPAESLPATVVVIESIPTTVYTIRVESVPSDLQALVNGTSFASPFTFQCRAGETLNLSVPSPQVRGGTQHLFASWSDNGSQTHPVVCTGNSTYVATFSTRYKISLETSPPGLQVLVDGVAQVAQFSLWCNKGASVGLDVPSPQGAGPTRHTFASWSDGHAVTRSITCNAPQTLTASFREEHRISLDTSPSELPVLLNGQRVTTPHGFWCEEGSNFTLGADVVDRTDGRYVFASWSDGGSREHPVTCSSPGSFAASFAFERSPPPTTNLLPVFGALAILVGFGIAIFLWLLRRKRVTGGREAGSSLAPPNERKGP